MDEADHYTLRQAIEITGIRRSAVRRLIDAGLVIPRRAGRRSYRLGFRDLVALRMAKGLWDAKLSSRRIAASLTRLRRLLPAFPPPRGLRVAAIGNEVVVSEGAARWQIDDGQYVLAFEVSGGSDGIVVVECDAAAAPDWFAQGLAAEASETHTALECYAKALAADPCHAGAFVNRGRLLHADGRLEQAEENYEAGLAACPDDPTLLFNFAVLREDQDRRDDARRLYERCIAQDPGMVDAHYNLGLLHQSGGRPRDAVRHFNAYRKLTAAGAGARNAPADEA